MTDDVGGGEGGGGDEAVIEVGGDGPADDRWDGVGPLEGGVVAHVAGGG